MKCLSCGTDMICKIEGHCLSWNCPNCGDGVATSHFEPIEVDQTKYTLTIMKIALPTKEEIRLTSQILNVNFLLARRLLIDGTAELSERAQVIQKAASSLKDSNIPFSICPSFPYSF